MKHSCLIWLCLAVPLLAAPPRLVIEAESAAEILIAILSPSERQRSALEEDEAWPAEVRQFASTVLGLRIKTKSHKWQPIQQELATILSGY